MNKKLLGVAAGLTVLAGIAIPAYAFAQDNSSNEFCTLMTPAVRDVIQDAPAISAVLNLDAAASDATIAAQRTNIGCGKAPAQTEAQARSAVCGVLTEARVEELVKETNNPNTVTLLETVRPALPKVLATARVQIKCDSAAPVTDGPTTGNDAPVTADVDCAEVTREEAQRILDADKSDPNRLDANKNGVACEAGDAATTAPVTKSPQVGKAPRESVETGW